MVRLAIFALFSLWAVVSATAQSVSAPVIEGRVALAAPPVLLVETPEGTRPVVVLSHAILEGVASSLAIAARDRVTVEPEFSERGVIWARRICVNPSPAIEGGVLIGPQELDGLLGRLEGRPPSVVDCRDRRAYAGGHIPGSTPWADHEKLTPVERESRGIVFVGEDRYDLEPFRKVQHLRRIGAAGDRILAGGVEAWSLSGRILAVAPEGVPSPPPLSWDLAIVDVRTAEEFEKGHIPGAFHVAPNRMLPQHFARMGGMPPMLFCGDAATDAARAAARRVMGWRYQNSVSLDGPVSFLEGGFEAWKASGGPLETGPARASFSLDALARPEEVRVSELAGDGPSGAAAPLLVDLRRADEPRPPQTLHIPLEDLPGRMGELPKGREILLFCTMGIRSRIGYEILRRNGYRVRYFREKPL